MKKIFAVAAIAALAGIAGTLAMLQGRPAPETAASSDPGQLWTCSMHPQVLQKTPGLCPICAMQLTPLRQVSEGGSGIEIDPVVVQNMGVRTARVEEGPLTLSIRTVGYLREDETRQVDVTLKVGGWIKRLHAHTEGMAVRQGDPIFDLYSPDLLVAFRELLLARGTEDLLKSARRKLELWDVPAEAIEEALRTGQAGDTVTFRSPANGFVTEKPVVQGSPVEPMMKILRISDHSVLWVDAQIYERQLPHAKIGQKARAMVSGSAFEGDVLFVSPKVDPTTRSTIARIAIPNEALLLKPGQYATVEFSVEAAPSAILVPREAVIDTGVRQVAFVALDGGRFESRDVRTGAETGDGRIQILSGLAAGEPVVVSGQFLLDSESRLREAIRKMASAESKPLSPALEAYLSMARALAEDRTVEVDALREAAPGAVAEAAELLRDRPIKEQREAFKALSEAVIEFATATPSGRLFILKCEMVGARWLQATETPENPYYGSAMHECGGVVGTIPGEKP